MLQVDKIVMFNNGGVPIVLFDFNKGELVVDETLLSGFLSAIDGFSLELFQNQSSHFLIDNGIYKISLFKRSKVVMAAISSVSLMDLKPEFDNLLKYFENTYPIGTIFTSDVEIYEDFRVKLIRTLFYLPIAEDWIPSFKENANKIQELKNKYPVLNEIDGNKSIYDLSDFNQEDSEKVYEILNFAHFEGAIDFEYVIEPKDYVIGTKRLQEILTGNPDEYKKLKQQYSEINLIDLIKDLAIPLRVHEIQEKYNDKVTEILKSLYDDEYLEILDEKFRQILIIMDIINDLLGMLQKLDSKGIVLKFVKETVNSMDEPDIISRINFEGNNVSINKANFYSKFLDQKAITKIAELWLNFLMQLIDKFYPKFKDKLNQMMFNRLTEHYMQFIHNKDMKVLDSVLMKFESQF